MSLKDKKVTGSLINFDESNFNDYYKKEDVDEAVKKTEERISKLFKARLKGLHTENKATREFIKFRLGVKDIIKEVFE